MAPNLPESTSFHSLDLSQHFDASSKFLPSKFNTSTSFASKTNGRVEDEIEARDVVSCDNIVANLLAQKESNSNFIEDSIVRPVLTEESKVAEESYWNNPPVSFDETHSKRDYFSSDFLEKMLMKDVKRRRNIQTEVNETARTFHQEPTSREESNTVISITNLWGRFDAKEVKATLVGSLFFLTLILQPIIYHAIVDIVNSFVDRFGSEYYSWELVHIALWMCACHLSIDAAQFLTKMRSRRAALMKITYWDW